MDAFLEIAVPPTVAPDGMQAKCRFAVTSVFAAAFSAREHLRVQRKRKPGRLPRSAGRYPT
jgi:hypothetical protein